MTSTLKSIAFVVFATVALPFATGCGAAATSSTVASGTTPKVERRVIAEGVELVVSEEAGVEARRIVEEFQAEMRARYISAR